jgi:hypothetical protein
MESRRWFWYKGIGTCMNKRHWPFHQQPITSAGVIANQWSQSRMPCADVYQPLLSSIPGNFISTCSLSSFPLPFLPSPLVFSRLLFVNNRLLAVPHLSANNLTESRKSFLHFRKIIVLSHSFRQCATVYLSVAAEAKQFVLSPVSSKSVAIIISQHGNT